MFKFQRCCFSFTFATRNRVLSANTVDVYIVWEKKSAQMTKSDRFVESIVLNWKAIGTNGARSLWRGANRTHNRLSSAVCFCFYVFAFISSLYLSSTALHASNGLTFCSYIHIYSCTVATVRDVHTRRAYKCMKFVVLLTMKTVWAKWTFCAAQHYTQYVYT